MRSGAADGIGLDPAHRILERQQRGLSGYRAGARLTREILLDLHDDDGLSDVGFPAPSEWRSAEVCALSGHLATPHCDHVVTEWFAEPPTRDCPWHRSHAGTPVLDVPPLGRVRGALEGPVQRRRRFGTAAGAFEGLGPGAMQQVIPVEIDLVERGETGFGPAQLHHGDVHGSAPRPDSAAARGAGRRAQRSGPSRSPPESAIAACIASLWPCCCIASAFSINAKNQNRSSSPRWSSWSARPL